LSYRSSFMSASSSPSLGYSAESFCEPTILALLRQLGFQRRELELSFLLHVRVVISELYSEASSCPSCSLTTEYLASLRSHASGQPHKLRWRANRRNKKQCKTATQPEKRKRKPLCTYVPFFFAESKNFLFLELNFLPSGSESLLFRLRPRVTRYAISGEMSTLLTRAFQR